VAKPGERFGPEEFAEATSVSRETLSRLEAYAALLMKWQKAVNLVSPGDIADLWYRHILDSAQLLPLLPPAPEGRDRVIADLGSGAGFPGMVLAILGAGSVHLFESDARKCAFLLEAARVTNAPATVHNIRIETVPEKMPGFRADVVTARALAPLSKLLALAAPLIEKGGVCLFLKGETAGSELTAAGKEWNMRVEQLPSRTSRSGLILRIGGLAIDGASDRARKPRQR
jgi:16S rRNA (guanine527-N7)-methyltransferase